MVGYERGPSLQGRPGFEILPPQPQLAQRLSADSRIASNRAHQSHFEQDADRPDLSALRA